MDNLPLHMRITSLTPTNEDVDARRTTITAAALRAMAKEGV